MYEMIENFGTLQMVEALGFCRYLLRECGHDIESGIILVVEELRQAKQIIETLLETTDAVEVKTGNRWQDRPLNFQMGMRLFQKYDKVETIANFLQEKDFLPVLFVVGIVPEEIGDFGYIFKLEACNEEIAGFAEMYQEMRKTVVQKFPAILDVLGQLTTSKIFGKYGRASNMQAVRMVIATGEIWKLTLRSMKDEEETEMWCERYCQIMLDKVSHTDDYRGMYAVGMAVADCVFSYGRIQSLTIAALDEFLEMTAEILSDEACYYFPETLLKEICHPLLETVSFLQLKAEMYAEGMLVCNDCAKKNYTVKVTVRDKTNGEYKRIRLLKIRKEFLQTQNGMSLEDWLDIKNEVGEVYTYVD